MDRVSEYGLIQDPCGRCGQTTWSHGHDDSFDPGRVFRPNAKRGGCDNIMSTDSSKALVASVLEAQHVISFVHTPCPTL